MGLAGRPANRWCYRFEPNGDGTDRRTNLENMRTTLERIKAAAEAD